MEMVREGVLKPKKDVQHLDSGKVISYRRWLHGPAEELNVATDDVECGWQRIDLKIDTKAKVATELGS